ncbi:hypothetical protein D3C80_994040 [compost metagenome]
MGIAAQHQAVCPHLATGRVQGHAGAVLDSQYGALFEDAHAQAMRGTGFALDQIQWVQVARAHVYQAAGVLVAGDDFVQLPRAYQTGFRAIAKRCQVILLVLESGELLGCVGQFAETPAQVAGNAVLGNAAGHQRHRIDAGLLQVAHAVLADMPGKAADIMADAANQLAAIAPAGAPADAPAFQQHHRQAAFSQFQGGVDAGQPAADHAHIGRQFAVQAGVGRRVACRGSVVRSSVLGIERHGRSRLSGWT